MLLIGLLLFAALTHTVGAIDCAAITSDSDCDDGSDGQCQYDQANSKCENSPCLDQTDPSTCRGISLPNGQCRFVGGKCARHSPCSDHGDSTACWDAECWMASESSGSDCFDVDNDGCTIHPPPTLFPCKSIVVPNSLFSFLFFSFLSHFSLSSLSYLSLSKVPIRFTTRAIALVNLFVDASTRVR